MKQIEIYLSLMRCIYQSGIVDISYKKVTMLMRNTLRNNEEISTIETMNYYPLFRVRSWNNGAPCMSFYILIEVVGIIL